MRDTDEDWRRIGETEPYFGVLTDDSFRRDQLTEESLAKFYESGRREVHRMLGWIRRFGTFKPKSAIDFGCGVGRLTKAMAEEVADVTGVDVSEPMLAIARADAPKGVRYSSSLPDTLVDWVASYIVFQHIAPERGYALFEQLLTRVAPGGWMSVHFTFYRDARQAVVPAIHIQRGAWDGEHYRIWNNEPQDGAAAVNDMVMYDYDLTRLIAIAKDAGIADVLIVGTDHGGHHGGYLFGRKAD